MNEPQQPAFDLAAIVARFAIAGAAAAIEPHGSGHIHDTFRVRNARAGHPDYLLQRINHHVFQNVPALMANIRQVTAHLRQKISSEPGGRPDQQVLTLVPTLAGPDLYQDEDHNYWRMYLFLEDAYSYDQVQSPQQAYEGGRAFGRFQALLADLPASSLHDTIPHFHDIQSRLRLFRDAVARNPRGRVQQVPAEIAAIEERAEAMSRIYRLGQRGALPLRITHNDTKFNNVLLDQSHKARCVIDLDTVMPGYVAYDFGDAIRTTVNTAAEDEADTSKIGVNMDLFAGFAQGFLEETQAFLSDTEVASLSLGVLLLPYIMGLRFLTDYIDGDHYYKIHFPQHNLQRSRAQLALVARLEARLPEMERLIGELCQRRQPGLAVL